MSLDPVLWPSFAQPLIQTVSAFLSETEIDDKGVRDLTKTNHNGTP